MTRPGAFTPISPITGALALWLAAPATAVEDHAGNPYAEDARGLAGLIRENYAYLGDLPGGVVPTSPALEAERDAVHDKDSLLRYAEDMMTALADHHALTGTSFNDDWAIVPSYADLWIVKRGNAYFVDAVKEGSVAARSGVRQGERLVMVDGRPIAEAVSAFWARLGLQPVGERGPYAARVLAAGRRDRPRVLTFADRHAERTLTLDSVYKDRAERSALTVFRSTSVTRIRFNNSIGDQATIGEFDAAMAKVAPGAPVVIDVSDTPSGGNSSIARAVMGWFVRKPMPYQMHQLPAEERETGIPRQWVEYVLPRPAKYHPGPVSVRVGRWTASMGEGIAVGFQALGKAVCGTRMAGLKGAVYDFDLPKTGLRVKFPAERIYTVSGVPRHQVLPRRCARA